MKKSLIINLMITLVTSILSFISNKYFSIYMGIETLGLMKLFTQMVAYLNLADMGIGTASAYALYKPLAEKNKDEIEKVISTIDYFYKRISIGILLLGLFINLFLHKFIEVTNYGNFLYLYWSLYIFNTAITYFYAKFSILFTANQEFDKVRIIQGSGRVIFQILQIVFLIKIQSFIIFILIMISENIYLYMLYRRHYVKNYNIKKVKYIDKKIVKNTKNIFWHKLAAVIVFNTDYIVLSKFTSLVIVGIYSSYLMVYQILIVLINIISGVIAPKIGKFIAENDKNKIYKKWKEIYIIYFYISTFLVICTYYLMSPFVKIWLGSEYLLPNFTVMLILINLFIQMIRWVTETFKSSSGYFDDTYSPFLESIINLIFSLGLVQKIGLDGVIIGTIISNIVVILVLKPILVFKNCFDRKALDYFKISSEYFFLSILSFILINFILKKVIKLVEIFNWIQWLIEALKVSITSILIVTIIFLLNKNFRKLLKIIKI